MSAQISVEVSGELARTVKVSVPAGVLFEKETARLKELAKNADLKGFRQGANVPMRVRQQRFDKIRKRYESAVRYEVIDEVINETLQEAYKSHNIQPVVSPKIENFEPHAQDKDLTFTALIEVLPEVKAMNPADFKVERLDITISEKDIETTIKALLESRATYETVERKGKAGDKALVDIQESVDDAVFPEEYVEDVDLPILEKGEEIKVIPGLLESLIGKKAGDEFEVKTGFPEDWADKSMAGKKVVYRLRVKAIQEKTVPTLTDEFVKAEFGDKESAETVHEKAKADLEGLAARIQKNDAQFQISEALLQHQAVALPEGLVMQEAHNLFHQHHRDSHAGKDHDFQKELEALPAEEQKALLQRARKSVASALLMEVEVKHHQLKANQEAVTRRAIEYAQQFQDPQKALKELAQNQNFIRQLHFDDLVSQWIELILKNANITSRAMSLEEAKVFKRDALPLPARTAGE